VITIATPSGTVRAVPSEADPAGAVRYRLTGAARGTVHVTATSSPARWDRFDAVRATLGSASAREWPAEPLVRIRGRAYQGKGQGAGLLRRRALGGGRTRCPWSTPRTAPRPSRPARR
jgi:hypothetical protein